MTSSAFFEEYSVAKNAERDSLLACLVLLTQFYKVPCSPTTLTSNLPLEKKLNLLRQQTMSFSTLGVGYWVAVTNHPKEAMSVMKLLETHMHSQQTKRAVFVNAFMQNEGISSLLTIYEDIEKEIILHKGKYLFPKRRSQLLTLFEIMISTPPYKEPSQSTSKKPPVTPTSCNEQ